MSPQSTAIQTLNDIADDWFGYDPDRYYWTHCTVTDHGAVFIGAIQVGHIGSLDQREVEAIKPILDRRHAERDEFNAWRKQA